MVVPAGRLDFHMLPDDVEAQLLRMPDIELQRVVGRRGVEAVGPPALIEKAELEKRLAVQKEPIDAGAVAAHRDAAHAEIAVDLIVAGADAECIQKRIGRRPRARIRERDVELTAGRSGPACNLASSIEHRRRYAA